MTEATHARIPRHLHRYIVEQNYDRYTAEDQAVWRYIMRQLKSFLALHAHESYLDGLQKTGIDVDAIPRIEDIDAHLERFGWGAVPVSGFIPPAAFMEFQSIGVLPIASDMRTLDHLLYTPAPDIVHEAAGHAPILVHPEYAAYLRQYGAVARHSILTKEDLDQYEAIRLLSDIKEDPRSTPEIIAKAEQRLTEVNRSLSIVSEAALLGRMNWWTAEYGLIGDIARPRIFGAGLLSSVGESRAVLDPKVKKIPLSVECVDYSYDITEPQPQLFVTRDFGQLGEVLEQLAKGLAYRQGGVFGLKRAHEARTVNTVELNSGLQISGIVAEYLTNDRDEAIYIRMSGPSQLSREYQEIEGQGTAHHPEGFSTPLGRLRGQTRCLSTFNVMDLEKIGIVNGKRGTLEFESGIRIEGTVSGVTYHDGRALIITWRDCRAVLGGRTLFDPAWGTFDMAVGSAVKSVFGGAADRERFGSGEDFIAKRVPARVFNREELKRHETYQILRDIRAGGSRDQSRYRKQLTAFLTTPDAPWLIGLELLELADAMGASDDEKAKLRERLSGREL